MPYPAVAVGLIWESLWGLFGSRCGADLGVAAFASIQVACRGSRSGRNHVLSWAGFIGVHE